MTAVTAEPLHRLKGALCRKNPDLFFGSDTEPERDRLAREKLAKAVCDRCPLLTACRDFALATNQKTGVWGGMSESERASHRETMMRRARQRRRIA